MMTGVRFTIVTPSLHQLDWLKLAVRSIVDQGVDVNHLIQDGGTGLELETWVRDHSAARLTVEPDGGMYEALNRGFAKATGDIWAWLNCDEQYLPGTLAAVEARFAENPDMDILLADNLVVDEGGRYLAHRFSLVPTVSQLWVRFPVASCALFFRPRIWRPFETKWKSAADWWWFRDLLERGARIGILRRFVATFAETRSNLGLAAVTSSEQAQILAVRPWWIRLGRPLILASHRWRMWRSGAFSVRPFHYSIYLPEAAFPPGSVPASGTVKRREFSVARPNARWVRPT